MNESNENINNENINNVNNLETFIVFVKALIEDRKKAVQTEVKQDNPYTATRGWENTSIEDFLEAAIAWIEDGGIDEEKKSNLRGLFLNNLRHRISIL